MSSSDLDNALSALRSAGWIIRIPAERRTVKYSLNPEIIAIALAGAFPAFTRKHPSDPYKGKRQSLAPSAITASQVDIERMVLRYTRDYWCIAQCMRHFGLKSFTTTRNMLAENGAVIREGSAELDEKAVVRCYERLRLVSAVAFVFETDPKNISRILAKHGESTPERPARPVAGNRDQFSTKTPRDTKWKEHL